MKRNLTFSQFIRLNISAESSVPTNDLQQEVSVTAWVCSPRNRDSANVRLTSRYSPLHGHRTRLGRSGNTPIACPIGLPGRMPLTTRQGPKYAGSEAAHPRVTSLPAPRRRIALPYWPHQRRRGDADAGGRRRGGGGGRTDAESAREQQRENGGSEITGKARHHHKEQNRKFRYTGRFSSCSSFLAV